MPPLDAPEPQTPAKTPFRAERVTWTPSTYVKFTICSDLQLLTFGLGINRDLGRMQVDLRNLFGAEADFLVCRPSNFFLASTALRMLCRHALIQVTKA